MKPTTNNLEGWEKKLENISYDIDDEDLTNEPVIPFSNAKQFISDLRKHDMEELINKFTDDLGLELNGREIKQLIKEYYNKLNSV